MIKPGGLGLYLIRNAFDEVDYLLKRRGTELVLTKNLEQKNEQKIVRTLLRSRIL
jgi:anti-sigma regulatory factor (Ser/Thr protein kinase)